MGKKDIFRTAVLGGYQKEDVMEQRDQGAAGERKGGRRRAAGGVGSLKRRKPQTERKSPFPGD